MSHFKRIPVAVVPILLVLLGLGAALAGCYLLLGLAPALILGGITSAAVGLLVDF